MGGILHVCQANRCRSPIAEAISDWYMASWPPELRVPVGSAGTQAHAGQPMWSGAAADLRARGLDPSRFASRPLEGRLVRDADVVLAATRAVRDDVVTLMPRALRRIFTWRELAHAVEGLDRAELVGVTPQERLVEVVDLARARRGLRAAPPGDALDVVDPVGGPPGLVATTVEEIGAALSPLFWLLAPG